MRLRYIKRTIEDLTVETTSDNDASLHCLPDAAMNNETTMASTSQTPARVVKTRRNGEPNGKPVTTRTLAQVVSTMRDDATESDGFVGLFTLGVISAGYRAARYFTAGCCVYIRRYSGGK